jgi:hypothetical protein
MGDLCRRIVAGSPITIHYSTKSPKHNIASDPVTKLNYGMTLSPFCWPAWGWSGSHRQRVRATRMTPLCGVWSGRALQEFFVELASAVCINVSGL